jgi:hypothetical protein
VTPATAAQLAAQHPADAVRAQVEAFDWLVATKDRRLGRNPAGYLVQSIRDDYAAPPGFESAADRARRAEAERQARQHEAEQHRLRKAERAREAAEHARIAKYWDALDPAAQARLEADALAGADPSLRESYHASRGTPLEPMARRLIREDHIRRLLGLAGAAPAP